MITFFGIQDICRHIVDKYFYLPQSCLCSINIYLVNDMSEVIERE